jgi:hypothetical protein
MASAKARSIIWFRKVYFSRRFLDPRARRGQPK